MRFLYALVAAVLSLVLALVVVAALSLVMRDRPLMVATAVCFTLFPLLAFVWVYRVARKSKAALREEVEERRRLALARRLPKKALAIADGGEGVWLTDRWRVTGGATPTIEVVQDGQWMTVFQARFHPGREGQWVPAQIRESGRITSTEEGERAASWEVLVYRPGPWEEELDEQVRAAEEAALARERDRMGLT
ncbi:MAG TPA: hypothetical protein VF266_17490 [Thermoanaerobaculia bacterium]